MARKSDAEKTRYRATKMGYIFQAFNLLPVLTALENVEMPLLVSGVPAEESAPRQLKPWAWLALMTALTITLLRCPAVNNSALQSRVPL